MLARAGLVALVLLCGGAAVSAQETESGLSGMDSRMNGLGLLCKGAAVLTKQIDSDPSAPKPSQTAALERQKLQAWATVFAESGMTVQEFQVASSSPELAAMMANVEAQADPSASAPKDETSWSSFDIARTTLAVAGIADPLGATSVAAAYLYPKCSAQEAQTGKGGFCWKDSAVRGVGTIPKGCAPSHPEYQDGLCYAKCPAGMRGQGPVCWTDSKVSAARGVGVLPTACPADHPDLQSGLCYKRCPDGYGGVGPVCWQGIKSQGRGVGIPPKACDSAHPSFDNGLCYAACPQGYTGVGPVCWTSKQVSQPRGAGVIPTGCPADRPNLDAGLCYANCSSGTGIGPVCWQACSGRFKEACGAGCATDAVECGFATTDMVSSPFEVVINVVTLGTASPGTSAARASRKALQEGAREAAQKLAKQASKAAKLEGDALKAAADSGDDLVMLYARQAKAMGFTQDAAVSRSILDMAAEAGQANSSAARAAIDKMKASFRIAKARTDKVTAYIQQHGGKATAEYLKVLAEKGKKLAPQRNLAAGIDKTARGKEFLKRLEQTYDALHVQEVAAAKNLIVSCAKLGLAVSQQALGVE